LIFNWGTMTKIVICGVGGQGTILASDILSLVAMEEGYDVKKSEVHGMAQRGGSVISNCVFGKKVYSPLIGLGEGDILLAFEKLEALRSLSYLKKNGKMIVNDYEWLPITVASGDATYPENIIKTLKKKVENLICVDGIKIAADLGNIRTTNVVLLGVLARFLPFKQESWLFVLEKRVPKKTVEINKTAFLLGFASEA